MDLISMLLATILATIGTLSLLGGVHFIDEGNVGIYSIGGALLEDVSQPGLNFMVPLITELNVVQVMIQTDKVTDIPCGTSGGVLITFDKVEVVNRLKKEYARETIKNYTINYDQTWIFDKIHHEINQFCSKHTLEEVYITQFNLLNEYLMNVNFDNELQALQEGCNKWAPGIEIIAVRVSKPQIPHTVSKNYENQEIQKTELLIAIEEQKIVEIETETKRLLEKIEAETQSEINQMNMKKELLLKQSQQKIQEVQNQIELEKKKQIAESNYYRNLKQNEINDKKLSDRFIQYEAIQNLKNVKKIYYGDNINKYLEENAIKQL